MSGDNFYCHMTSGHSHQHLLGTMLYSLQCTEWHPLKKINYPTINVNDIEAEKQCQCKYKKEVHKPPPLTEEL